MESLILLATLALAAPPSTTLAGERGEISWTTTERDADIAITGVGTSWSVLHVADVDGLPIHTARTAADGTITTIDYLNWGVLVVTGTDKMRYVARDLWDADTIDLRLAELLHTSDDTLDFRAIDLADRQIHRFRAVRREVARCGGEVCTEIDLKVRGGIPGQGPTWAFWYDGSGRLIKMQGIGGSFSAPADALAASNHARHRSVGDESETDER